MAERNIGDVEVLIDRDANRMKVSRVSFLEGGTWETPTGTVTVQGCTFDFVEYDGPIPPRPDSGRKG